MKRILALIIALLCVFGVIGSNLFAGKKVTLKMMLWNPNDYDYFTQTDPIVAAFKKVNPDVTIELERTKNSEEQEKLLKIRNSANELPDIVPLKPYMLVNFKDVMLVLNDLTAAKNNLYASEYAVEGKVIGIPQMAFNEFVFYRKSIFKELGLSVPQTWDEFVELTKKIKTNGKYVPIALGGKDVWPDYPFNEFMPCLEAGNGSYWNTMATLDEPFSPNLPFYKSYLKIKKLYDAKPFGSDPLGVSFEQSRDMFIAKKAAMIAAGQWFLGDYSKMKGDMDDLGLFFLPVREKKSDPFIATAMADIFLGISKNSKNREEAKQFINWFFSSYYPKYVKALKVTSTVKGIQSDEPILKQAYKGISPKFIVYDGGNEKFGKIKDAIKFDVKRLGQEMLMGADLDKMMSDLNKQWKKAKNK